MGAACAAAAEALGYAGAVEVGVWAHGPRGCFVGHQSDGWINTYFSSIPVDEQSTGNADYRSICLALPPVIPEDTHESLDCASIMDPNFEGESVSQWMQDWFVYQNFVRGTALDAGGKQG